MKPSHMYWQLSAAAVAFLALALALAPGCRQPPNTDGAVRLGYVKSVLAATIYVAESQAAAARSDRTPAFIGVPLNSSGDIGYALIAGDIDAGFMETAKAAALLHSVNGLQPIGAVTFPYGATLVLRKDLNIRLDELAGRSVAVPGPRCRLLHQLASDAERLGVFTGAITFLPMHQDQMIPALEAGRVDAILTRGGHALLAVAHDHKVLYQSWEVSGDDQCCPQTLAQVELILVTRADTGLAQRIESLLSALATASAVAPDITRAAVAAQTRIAPTTFATFPVVSFAALTPEQQAELLTAKATD